MAAGWLYDGESAVRRSVEVTCAHAALRIAPDEGTAFDIAVADLVHIESRSDAEIYGRSDGGGWRLTIVEPIPGDLLTLLPSRRVYGGWIDRIGLLRAVVISLLISAAVLFLGQQFPAWLAPLVPQRWERKFGDALIGDFGGKFCKGRGAQQALDKLAARLSPHSNQLRIRIIDLPIVNAASLPGGRIVIFRELINQADGPDEVAGVLAHEIGHIEHRDVTEAMLRQLGFSVVLTSVGGNTAGDVEALMAARYSRRAEAHADGYAIEALRHAGISPLPTAAFFKRLAATEQQFPTLAKSLVYLSTHPLSTERFERFERAAKGGHGYAPSLTDAEWKAIVYACGGQSGSAPTASPTHA